MSPSRAGFGTASHGETPIERALVGLLRYGEVLGAVAISNEGLVLGSAGFGRQDAEMVGALGAALVGAVDRSARRLGAGAVHDLVLRTDGGMVHVRNAGDFAVVVFSERCDPTAVGELCMAAAEAVGAALI